jgi:hypothetical protein
MKNLIYIALLLLVASCQVEAPRAALIEFTVGSDKKSYVGTMIRYRDFVNGTEAGFDWHVFNEGKYSMYIQAYDNTFEKKLFNHPEFTAVMSVELKDGASKTYQATSGQFRLLGMEVGEQAGDFSFKMKNINNPDDSLMVYNGFFRIQLDYADRNF